MKKTFLLFSFIFIAAGYDLRAQYTKLLDFAGTSNGRNPGGTLVSDGTFLYGTTMQGGVNSYGTLFKIMPDGTGYVKLLDFAAIANGSLPASCLFYDGTFLYGTASSGGANGYGTLFKIKPNGTGFLKLIDFGGAATGRYPASTVYSDGTYLYGNTNQGGVNGFGTIYKIKPDGTGYSLILDFAGASNGSSPDGTFISDGTFLYGTTYNGGTSDKGVVFRIKPDGTGFLILLDCAGASNGSNPRGTLTYDGTFLYGTTYYGGTSGLGTLFKIKPDGTGYVKLVDFSGTANGSQPWEGALVTVGGYMYGMAEGGGASSKGIIFRIKPDGSGFQDILDFAGTTNGWNPLASLYSDGTFLYGTTYQGGANNFGVIFKQCVPPNVIANASATTVCPGTSVTVTGGGTDTYAWSGGVTNGIGFVPTTTTTYTVTGTVTASGCQNTAVATITVKSATASSQTVTACDSYTLNAQTYTASGTYIQHTNNSQGCDSAITLNLTVKQSTDTVLTKTACDSYVLNSQVYFTSGTYVQHGTNVQGCDSTITLNLTINSSPVVGAGNNVTICTGGNTLLCGSGGLTYSWLPGGQTTPCIVVSPTVSSTYNVIGTGSNSCSGSASVTVTVDPCLEVSSALPGDEKILIRPNPNNGIFTVQIGEGMLQNFDYKISIYNMLGECIFGPAISNFRSHIDISSHGSGIYLLNVSSEKTKENRTIKLLIQ